MARDKAQAADEIERLTKALAESCEDNRELLLRENPFGPSMCPVAERLTDENRRLKSRLEVYRDGDESTDGIACRDETIRLLEKRIERLTDENAELEDYIVELENALDKAAIRISRLTYGDAK